MDTESQALLAGASIHNNQAIINILSTRLACAITVYSNYEQTEYIECMPTENTTDSIALLHIDPCFHILLDPDLHSAELMEQLRPFLKQAEVAPVLVTRNELMRTIYNQQFNHLLSTTFEANAAHLAEIHGIYSLCLVSDNSAFYSNALPKNTIYLRPGDNKFDYRIKNPSGETQRGQLTRGELKLTITPTFSTVDLANSHNIILNALAKKRTIPYSVPARPMEFIDVLRTPYLTQTEGRVLRLNAVPEARNAQQLLSSDRIKLSPSQSIGSGFNWAVSLAKSAGVSALFSTARFDIAAVVSAISMGSLELGALALASLPFFMGSMVASLGVAVMGKAYAVGFEEAIRLAKSHIDAGDYLEGMKCLDTEFLRWFGARASRHAFLTKEHFALAHFLRGTCAFYNDDEPDPQKAYDEYEAAAADAKSANHLSLLMVTQLQRITMLKQESDLVPKNGLAADVIKQIIVELNELVPDAFADLYWKFNDKIAQISERLLDPRPWDENEILIINQYLMADGIFILQHFGKGRGQFLELFFSFFQSTVLAAIHQTNWEYLQYSTMRPLKKQLNLPSGQNFNERNAPALYFSVQKMLQCAEQLHVFKQQHSELSIHPDIKLCIEKISTLAQGLFVHVSQEPVFEPMNDEFARIYGLLGIALADISQYRIDVNESVNFLADLTLDFNQISYQTRDDFLNAVIVANNPLIHSVSPTTGDTLLHRLITLTANPALTQRIQEAAKGLKASAYIRNHRHETPIYLLNTLGDPHGLLAIIDAEPMIKLGDELTVVDSFLKNVKENPSVEGHFLLLDGPAGTGKTSTVISHLTYQGYSVHEWSRGEECDGTLGGLHTRIQKFFSDAKKQAVKTKKMQILFIDEIDQITPLTKGGAIDPKYHSRDSDTATFQRETTHLKEHLVVLIGATNYPARIAVPMMSRAATNRIHFPLPDEEKRIKLLNFFFRAKAIGRQHIEQLAKIAVAYSPRQLQSFVDSIKERSITQEMMISHFNKYARTLTTAFKDEFQCADLFMPSFETEGDLAELFLANAELAEQMNRLKSEVTIEGNKHTLLYGPPGSGKTTAVRMFAQNSGRVLIAIQADESISSDELRKVFDRAKQLAPSIIFFDEMHNLARHGTRHGTFLQTEMDGITTNNITVIGATNYLERIESAILSRFTSKIELPRLDAAALGIPIKTSLLEKINQYGTAIYVDPELENELNHTPVRLSQECEGLSLRHISAAFSYLIGDLQRESNPHGITYLRFQDVVFSIFRMKMQEGVVNRIPDLMTSTAYIRRNRHSFFPEEIPTEGTQISGLALQPS